MSIPVRNADPANILASERTFFVTSTIAQKRKLLQSNRAARLFIDVLYNYRTQQKYLLHAFVVMPDHFHALITVRSISIERAVQLIKGGFAFHAGKEFGFQSPVWERGFSEVRIHESDHFERVRHYIHDNPVRRNLVKEPSQYPYSSACIEFEMDHPPQGLKPAA